MVRSVSVLPVGATVPQPIIAARMCRAFPCPVLRNSQLTYGLVAERFMEEHFPYGNGAVEKLDYAGRKWEKTFGLDRIGACSETSSIVSR